MVRIVALVIMATFLLGLFLTGCNGSSKAEGKNGMEREVKILSLDTSVPYSYKTATFSMG